MELPADAAEDWACGYPVELRLALRDPVDMGACLELASAGRFLGPGGGAGVSGGGGVGGGASWAASTTTGRASGSFHPDLSGLAAASLLRRWGLRVSSSDEYFLDEVYREDPNDTRPGTLLLQFTIEPPSGKAPVLGK